MFVVIEAIVLLEYTNTFTTLYTHTIGFKGSLTRLGSGCLNVIVVNQPAGIHSPPTLYMDYKKHL